MQEPTCKLATEASTTTSQSTSAFQNQMPEVAQQSSRFSTNSGRGRGRRHNQPRNYNSRANFGTYGQQPPGMQYAYSYSYSYVPTTQPVSQPVYFDPNPPTFFDVPTTTAAYTDAPYIDSQQPQRSAPVQTNDSKKPRRPRKQRNQPQNGQSTAPAIEQSSDQTNVVDALNQNAPQQNSLVASASSSRGRGRAGRNRRQDRNQRNQQTVSNTVSTSENADAVTQQPATANIRMGTTHKQQRFANNNNNVRYSAFGRVMEKSAATEPSDSTESQPEPSRRPARTSAQNKAHLAQQRRQKLLQSHSEQAADLIDLLRTQKYECMVCYDVIRHNSAVWSCEVCFNVFHLACVKKWSKQENSTTNAPTAPLGKWRCPGCQDPKEKLPDKYYCFCKKTIDPEYNPYTANPHSCGQVCAKPRVGTPCPHACVLQCHPGPCPPCSATRTEHCFCKRTQYSVRCSDIDKGRSCGQICGKTLSCGRHQCQEPCHAGNCKPCGIEFIQTCYCGSVTEERVCKSGELMVAANPETGEEELRTFSCARICGKPLNCGNHKCTLPCHPKECPPCPLIPSTNDSCACGKTPITKLTGKSIKPRKSCLDPLPTCTQVCGKLLACKVHTCNRKCHTGDCGHCLTTVRVDCNCKSASANVPCALLYTSAAEREHDQTLASLYKKHKIKLPFTCERVCGTLKNCGRHKCKNKCCPMLHRDDELGLHICHQVCGRRLSCGKHKCDLPCHAGECPPCVLIINQPVTCRCGGTAIDPPQPCGTKPPTCELQCSIARECGHAANHTCHFGPCPPCLTKVDKMCDGGHQIVKGVFCTTKSISCGKICGKLLRCGRHTCRKSCHAGPCDDQPLPMETSAKPAKPQPSSSTLDFIAASTSASATSSSTTSAAATTAALLRESYESGGCGHLCNRPLSCKHACKMYCHPTTPCKDECNEPVDIYCACKNLGERVSCARAKELLFQQSEKPAEETAYCHDELPPLLLCNEQCFKIQRNKALAEALSINPDRLEIAPPYSAALISFAKKNPSLIQSVETTLASLLTKSTKSFVFPHMPRERRAFVHELAHDIYGYDSFGVDPEPYRSVMIVKTPLTRVPTVTLLQYIKNPDKYILGGLQTATQETETQPETSVSATSTDPPIVSDAPSSQQVTDASTSKSKHVNQRTEDVSPPEIVWVDSPITEIDSNSLANQITTQQQKSTVEKSRNFWSSLSHEESDGDAN